MNMKYIGHSGCIGIESELTKLAISFYAERNTEMTFSYPEYKEDSAIDGKSFDEMTDQEKLDLFFGLQDVTK
jgi:hypothetical protein